MRDTPNINTCVHLGKSLHGCGFAIFVPGFDCDSALILKRNWTVAVSTVSHDRPGSASWCAETSVQTLGRTAGIPLARGVFQP